MQIIADVAGDQYRIQISRRQSTNSALELLTNVHKFQLISLNNVCNFAISKLARSFDHLAQILVFNSNYRVERVAIISVSI